MLEPRDLFDVFLFVSFDLLSFGQGNPNTPNLSTYMVMPHDGYDLFSVGLDNAIQILKQISLHCNAAGRIVFVCLFDFHLVSFDLLRFVLKIIRMPFLQPTAFMEALL